MPKPHLHRYTAVVTFHEGEPREIPYDGLQSVDHGFNFIRLDGGFNFISAKLVAEIEVKPNPHFVETEKQARA